MKTKLTVMLVAAFVFLGAAPVFWEYLYLREFPGISLSYCPTAADLEDGIVFKYRLNGGPITYFHRHKEGSVYLNARKDEISSEWPEAENYMGLMRLVTRPVKSGREIKRSYSDGFEKLFPLATGKEVSFTGVSEPEGKISSTDYHIRVAASYKKSVGLCSYEVYPLHFTEHRTYATGRLKTLESVKHYSPELAFVLSTDSSRPVAFEVDVVRTPGLLERLEWPFNEDRPLED